MSLIVACGGMGLSPAAAQVLPADVSAFVEKRQSCDHFRGEPAGDEERARFIAEQIALTCTGTDKALADLRRRHAANPTAAAALDDYETTIEYGPDSGGGASATIVVEGVFVPVTIDPLNIDPSGHHETRVIDRRGELRAVIDSYASRPQDLSRCQAGSERYFRLIDLTARTQRYATLIESCMANVIAADKPIAWSPDGTKLTINLLSARPVTLVIDDDGTLMSVQ